jgi:FG-GAP-like repeat
MPDLNADVSLFNLNNRGANASLQTARNTYNQLLTDMNWGFGERMTASAGSASPNRIEPTVKTLGGQDWNVEAAVRDSNSGQQLFYSTGRQTTGDAVRDSTPRILWMTDGQSRIDISAYLPNNDQAQQVFDIIGKRSDNYLYFSRERLYTDYRPDGSNPPPAANPHQFELWKTDGSRSGTQLVKSWDNLTGDRRSEAVAVDYGSHRYIVNDRVYVSFELGSSGQNGFELWESQGTTSSTVQLSTISDLAKRSPAGLGKVDLSQYGGTPSPYNYGPSKPIAQVEGSAGENLYFTLQSDLSRYKQPGDSYFEMWQFNRQSNQLTKLSDFNYYQPLLPKNYAREYLPSNVVTNRQSDYGMGKAFGQTAVASGYRIGSTQSNDPSTALPEAIIRRQSNGSDLSLIDFHGNGESFNFLYNLGEIRLPAKSFDGSNNGNRSDFLYFTRGYDEVWLANTAGQAYKLMSVADVQYESIQGVYALNDQLIVMTNKRTAAVSLTAKVDPIQKLLAGDYRGLKDLAGEIGGSALAQEVVIPEFDTKGWSINGIRDYDGDGDVDIFWRNNTSGQGVFWQMNGLKFEKGLLVGPQADYSGWEVRGFGDFDRDGDQDIFWQHYSGLNVIWEMQGLSLKSGTVLPTTTRDWYFSGIGNFNGDRNLEVLWRNANGTLVTWEIQDFKLKSGTVLPINVAGWSVQSISDFDNDGDSDILWRNDDSVTIVLWEMQSGQFKAGAALPPSQISNANSQASYRSDLGYAGTFDPQPRYGGQFDVNGDGKLDIWWRSLRTGRREAWTFKRDSQNILNYSETLTR